MAVVYTHTRLDNNKVFYVGIGKTKRRAFSKDNRNKHWYNIVSKHEYRVEITHVDICWEEACSIEKYMICFYGRSDLRCGSLVNLTDGGEGVLNPSDDIRNKIRIANKGERNPRYGKPGTMIGRFGELNPNYKRPYSKESLEIMRNKKIGLFDGEKNPMFGRTHTKEARESISRKNRENYLKYGSPKTKKVINTITGFVYNSVKEVADDFNVKVTTVRSWLNGWNKNPTSLKYLN